MDCLAFAVRPSEAYNKAVLLTYHAMNHRSLGFVVLLGSAFALSGCGLTAEPEPVQPSPNPGGPEVREQINEEEQAFLDSGRAKAIEDESDLWQLYEDREAGFWFQYPFDVGLSPDSVGQPYVMSVDVSPVEGLEGTMGYNEATALENLTALKSGLYGEAVDFPWQESKKLRQVGKVHAQDFVVFGRFEVCDVTLERKLYFFSGGRQAVLTLSVPRHDLAAAISDYLAVDAANCGDEPVWGPGEQGRLYVDLASGQAPAAVQRWYDRFDEIVGTMRFGDAESNEPSLIGRWMSLDDDKSVIEFTSETKTDYYDGENMGTDGYLFDSEGRLSVAMGEDEPLLYEVVELSDTDLTLRYLARGNDLRYRRME